MESEPAGKLAWLLRVQSSESVDESIHAGSRTSREASVLATLSLGGASENGLLCVA